jgi:hypothetical protein
MTRSRRKKKIESTCWQCPCGQIVEGLKICPSCQHRRWRKWQLRDKKDQNDNTSRKDFGKDDERTD